MKLVIVPLALAELHDAAAFSAAKGNVDLGLAFVAEFERTADPILANPRKGNWGLTPVSHHKESPRLCRGDCYYNASSVA